MLCVIGRIPKKKKKKKKKKEKEKEKKERRNIRVILARFVTLKC